MLFFAVAPRRVRPVYHRFPRSRWTRTPKKSGKAFPRERQAALLRPFYPEPICAVINIASDNIDMFQAAVIDHSNKTKFYRELGQQLDGLLHGESDMIANAANTSALIYQMLPQLNWAGFYFLKSADELVLGPFQGKPACVRIAVGRGVCGTAVAKAQSILVEDVHLFPGHIACDGASRSELVVPLRRGGRILGVLDLDSPVASRFDAEDQAGIERLAEILVAASD
jgi:GAF domain-containing protein